jgi:hypothetical protein
VAKLGNLQTNARLECASSQDRRQQDTPDGCNSIDRESNRKGPTRANERFLSPDSAAATEQDPLMSPFAFLGSFEIRASRSVELPRPKSCDVMSRLHPLSCQSDLLWAVERRGGKLSAYHVSVQPRQGRRFRISPDTAILDRRKQAQLRDQARKRSQL